MDVLFKFRINANNFIYKQIKYKINIEGRNKVTKKIVTKKKSHKEDCSPLHMF